MTPLNIEGIIKLFNKINIKHRLQKSDWKKKSKTPGTLKK